MYTPLLLESVNDIESTLKHINQVSHRFSKLGRALLLELSVLVVFVAGIYSGIYGTKAYGYDYFVDKSKNFVSNFMDKLLGKDKSDALKHYNNVNAFSLILLIFITLQIWSFYKLAKSKEKGNDVSNILKLYKVTKPQVEEVIEVANSHKFTKDKLENLLIASFLVSKKRYASDISTSEFLKRCVTQLNNGILKNKIIALVTLLVVFMFLIKKH